MAAQEFRSCRAKPTAVPRRLTIDSVIEAARICREAIGTLRRQGLDDRLMQELQRGTLTSSLPMHGPILPAALVPRLGCGLEDCGDVVCGVELSGGDVDDQIVGGIVGQYQAAAV
jgi:hypothetical protein